MHPSCPCPQRCWPSSRDRWPCAAVSLCRGPLRAALRRQPIAMCEGVPCPSPPCPCAGSSAMQHRRCLRRRSYCRGGRKSCAVLVRWLTTIIVLSSTLLAFLLASLLASLLAFGWFCSGGRSGGRCSLRRRHRRRSRGGGALGGRRRWFAPATSISSFSKSAVMRSAPTSDQRPLRGARDLAN